MPVLPDTDCIMYCLYCHRELYTLGYTERVDPNLVSSQITNLAASMGAGGTCTCRACLYLSYDLWQS